MWLGNEELTNKIWDERAHDRFDEHAEPLIIDATGWYYIH
jgi:hypothetical protein